MDLGFEEAGAAYDSPSQSARVWTESWVALRLFCLNCGNESLNRHPNNTPVADFFCASCKEQYELKSTKGRLGPKIVDGAYRTMCLRLEAADNPNLLLMTYDLASFGVTNLVVVPKHFFVPAIIEQRKPLPPTARRAGWVGCNILLKEVPQAGKIYVVRDRRPIPRETVLEQWRQTLFLREEGTTRRGWLLEVMKCVEAIGRREFTLDEVYAFEERLARLYPANNNVRPKIRQQLQVLRDRGYLEFAGRGAYRVARS